LTTQEKKKKPLKEDRIPSVFRYANQNGKEDDSRSAEYKSDEGAIIFEKVFTPKQNPFVKAKKAFGSWSIDG
jgi:hypothetical protein